MTVLTTILIGVMFWNVENFLEYDSGKSTAIGKTLLWAGAPEVLGLAEVGNAKIVRSICLSEVLAKCGYRFVHYDSPDHRGIDVALMYRPDAVRLVRSCPIRVKGLRTRDILYVCLEERNGKLWHIFVNHHPSKYGGAASSKKRLAAMRALLNGVDSLVPLRDGGIIAMGDFNDTPDSEALRLAAGRFVNKGARLLEEAPLSQVGTIRFHGKWELIDNFLVSGDVDSTMTMHILSPPFIMEKDRSYPGLKPKRTRVGPRFNGGISDHLPILLK